jgi:spore germination protein PE
MLRHVSIVNQINVISMGIDGVLQIGDSNMIASRNRDILVQREESLYLAQEGSFEKYVMFTDTEITIPTRQTSVRMHVVNTNPFVRVDRVEIISLLSSGIIHIGSTDYVFNNSRILQIRQFISEDPFEETPSERSLIP